MALVRAGVAGWTMHADLPGTPDFAFERERLAVFVDGCFWHGCPLHYRPPKTRRPFWRNKRRSNRARDDRVRRRLNRLDWGCMRVWEHSTRRDADAVVLRIVSRLRSRARS
jgi:DNA mismatch endonuclease (patch repair protein)